MTKLVLPALFLLAAACGGKKAAATDTTPETAVPSLADRCANSCESGAYEGVPPEELEAAKAQCTIECQAADADGMGQGASEEGSE